MAAAFSLSVRPRGMLPKAFSSILPGSRMPRAVGWRVPPVGLDAQIAGLARHETHLGGQAVAPCRLQVDAALGEAGGPVEYPVQLGRHGGLDGGGRARQGHRCGVADLALLARQLGHHHVDVVVDLDQHGTTLLATPVTALLR
ncbi:MAG: hypothetical protein IPG16_03450 [Comamonadaceae bacterium]|nr:hypothetical protein [Comamonadaceae bacterium]